MVGMSMRVSVALAPMSTDDARGWLARRVFPDGEEPDPRFTLANERTYLAWTRTALAFLAGGIALGAFDLDGVHPRQQQAVAVLVLVAGLCIAGGAAVRWVRVERAMRHGRPLPVPAIVPVLSAIVFVALAVTAVMILA